MSDHMAQRAARYQWRALALVFAPIVLAGALGAATGVLLLGLVGVPVAAGVAWRVSGGRTKGLLKLGLARPERWTRVILLGVLGALVTHVVIGSIAIPAASRVFGPPNLRVFEPLVGNTRALVGGLAVAWTVGAFAEEMVFRGFLLRWLAWRLGHDEGAWLSAVMLSSVIFGLGHLYQGGTGVIGTAAAGIVYASAMLLGKKSLWPAVLAHGLYDTFAFVSVFLGGVPGGS